MIALEQIKETIVPVIQAMNLNLYDIKWRQEQGHHILEIAIMNEDGTMDIDTCAMVSEKLSAVLDQLDLISQEYFLEVCSPGAERELRSEKDIRLALNEYVYVKLKNPTAGLDEVQGTLVAFEENKLHISYMNKAVKKSIEIAYDNVALIRLAVKI